MREEVLIEILSFLGALNDYSYLDRLGNAIDEVSILEALRDAIRAFYTNCSKEKVCVEYDRERKLGVICPEVKPEELSATISQIADRVSKGKIGRVEMIRLSRELALKAYAKIPEVRNTHACQTG